LPEAAAYLKHSQTFEIIFTKSDTQIQKAKLEMTRRQLQRIAVLQNIR
jgi:hypothetical protein